MTHRSDNTQNAPDAMLEHSIRKRAEEIRQRRKRDSLARKAAGSKGYINVAGQSGRKIYAAYTQDSPDGKRIILVTEHVLSEYEKTQNARATDYPLTIAKIQFDGLGQAQSGQVYPAAKVTVTPDGFVDIGTPTPNTATMIDITRSN